MILYEMASEEGTEAVLCLEESSLIIGFACTRQHKVQVSASDAAGCKEHSVLTLESRQQKGMKPGDER